MYRQGESPPQLRGESREWAWSGQQDESRLLGFGVFYSLPQFVRRILGCITNNLYVRDDQYTNLSQGLSSTGRYPVICNTTEVTGDAGCHGVPQGMVKLIIGSTTGLKSHNGLITT